MDGDNDNDNGWDGIRGKGSRVEVSTRNFAFAGRFNGGENFPFHFYFNTSHKVWIGFERTGDVKSLTGSKNSFVLGPSIDFKRFQ